MSVDTSVSVHLQLGSTQDSHKNIYKGRWKLKRFLNINLIVGVLAEYKVTDEQREHVKEMIKNVCKKNNAEDKVDEVVNKIKQFVDCLMGLFDFNTVRQEIEAAKPKGALDEVFKKYCEKSPQLKTCIHDVTAAVSPCLDQSQRERIPYADSATDQLIDFVCYKDGDRIAMFIAEGGPECFRDKASAIESCTTGIKSILSNFDEAKKLKLADQCKKVDELTSCVVKALEECDTPTPGNMAESLFRYIRKDSPCKDV
ncbi:unnamed protein product [Danaus chrysippus]|uniref:(African queen) hypothetical protein n=1 Tax=Danaus chrysippus TaxID=151541 RepID=A0A8J2QDW3_9NEOP|nr:unnamed protein product [Danaus chrysippus]